MIPPSLHSFPEGVSKRDPNLGILSRSKYAYLTHSLIAINTDSQSQFPWAELRWKSESVRLKNHQNHVNIIGQMEL